MESSLVKKAQKGDWQAYLRLALTTKDQLYRRALMLTSNEADAADAVEEALVQGFTAIGSLQNPQHFYTWLYRILTNKCLDILRQASKLTVLHKVQEQAQEGYAEQVNEQMDMHRQLQKLDEKFRVVLVLRFYDDLKVDEIARLLHLPPGTVKSRIYHGLKRLKTHMEEEQVNEM